MPLKKNVKILAIESSADETSAAVLVGNRQTKEFRLLSNIIYSQITAHRKTGGIVPEVAARMHLPKILPAIRLALKKSKSKLTDIDYLAVTAGPGLVTSLMIGVDTAKALAFALQKPIVPINHMEGHLLSATANLQLTTYYFPALGLTVSGGHTMLVLLKNIGQYHILGQTLDDAAGEAFDKIAKILGLPYPGGPEIAKSARHGKPTIDFPRPMIDSKNYNFSFAGLKTAVLYYYNDVIASGAKQSSDKKRLLRLRQRADPRNDENLKADIAASVEQAIVDVLVAKTLRAAKEHKVKTILLGGGVAANEQLRKILERRIKKDLPATNYQLPSPSLTTDNAGMIALAAFYHVLWGRPTTYANIRANPNWELRSWR